VLETFPDPRPPPPHATPTLLLSPPLPSPPLPSPPPSPPRSHPDPVVENATLSATPPPPITYNLNIPSKIITDGKLSALQLEAVIYGSQKVRGGAEERRSG
jgi:hypothetical protein